MPRYEHVYSGQFIKIKILQHLSRIKPCNRMIGLKGICYNDYRKKITKTRTVKIIKESPLLACRRV